MMKAIFYAGASVLALLSTAAHAQVAPAPAADAQPGEVQATDAQSSNEIQDIVVTAKKRSERINDVGMAITAVGDLALTQRNITSIAGLTKLEPSLQISQSNNGTPVYTIRGVGYFEQSLTATPTVSVYQDEVAYTYPAMTKGALLDVERVEILKGPQGTLYGQNATGGAINFVAAKPTKTLQAGLEGTVARFGAYDLSGFISGPITETLGVRVAGRLEQGGAWQKSITRDETLGDRDNKFMRVIAAWEPSSTFKAELNVNGWSNDSDTQAGQLEGVRFQGPNLISSLTPNSFLPVQPYSQYPAGIQAFLAQPASPRNNRAADWEAGTTPRAHQRFYQGTLRLDFGPSPAFGVTTITNYEHYKQNDRQDIGATAAPSFQGILTGTVSTFSQEVRAHGEIGESLKWVIGGNLDRTITDEVDHFPFAASDSYTTVATPFGAFGLWTQFSAFNYDRATTTSAFGSVDYKILPNLTLNGGIRFTDSNQDLKGCADSDNAGLYTIVNFLSVNVLGGQGGGRVGQCITLDKTNTPGFVYNKLHQTNVPFRVGLEWKATPDNLLYASVTKGYKAGSAPALGAATADSFEPVTQESVLSYEGGFKSTLFERRLQLNASAFYYDYRDKQFLGRLVDPLGLFGILQRLYNVPKSREIGAEVSAELHPGEGVTLTGAATYLNSKVISNFVNYASYANSATDTVNFKGEAFPFTPKWSLQGGARYDVETGSGMKLFVNADGHYQTDMVAAFGAAHAATEGPPLDIPGYATLDLGAGITTPDGRWSAIVFGKNVTNKYYLTSVYYAEDSVVRITGRPATYGLTLKYRWGS